MTIYDLLTVTPANRTLSIYNNNNEYVETIGMKEILENSEHNKLYQKEIDRITPTNCKYLLVVTLK